MIKRLIEYLIIERRTEYIQYESSLKSSNARNYTSYSTLKTISIKISTEFAFNVNVNNNQFIIKFAFKKLKFFDYKYNKKTTTKNKFIKNTFEKTIYKNLYIFKLIASSRDFDLISKFRFDSMSNRREKMKSKIVSN